MVSKISVTDKFPKHLAALPQVRPINRVTLFDLDAGKAEALAA